MSGPFPAPKKGRPVFVVIVDIAAQADFLELAKLALTATLGALPANALIGVITVSNCVCLFAVSCCSFAHSPYFDFGENCRQGGRSVVMKACSPACALSMAGYALLSSRTKQGM
jgi:hypothetical protein